MKVTPKTIQEELARAKANYLRNDAVRTLFCLAGALKGVVALKNLGPDRPRIDTMLREAYQNINKLPQVKEHAPQGLAYLKGEEQKMLAVLLPVLKKVDEAHRRESLEAMRARKLLIDQMVIKGTKLLADNNVPEAVRCFREAAAEFKDESGLFPLIATRLSEAGHHKASIEFSRRAILESPDNPRAYDLLRTALTKTGEYELGEKFLAEARKQIAESALLEELAAFVLAKKGDMAGAVQAAQSALALDPSLDLARKLLSQAQAKTAPSAA